jgi:N-acetyl-anhydromuramyl-L-alanine amidase AmpD
LPLLQEAVDQFVLHYDVCGTSRQCFNVLHDKRGLSVHFLLDLDGTIYQTLDLKERAWHAAATNDRSVGIEIANIGAYPDREVLDRWYTEDEGGSRITIPEGVRRGALAESHVLRPARPGPIEGVVHDQRLLQQDFTAEQYEALAHLLAALSRVLPRCRLVAPRAPDGTILSGLLPEGEARDDFEGVLGHWHVSGAKVDPGPALDWDRVLARARSLGGVR